MRIRAAAAIALSLLLWTFPASAQEWLRDYGGSGKDVLYELTSIGEDILVSGSTSSTDGDLKIRTRTGETGWLLRLKPDGSVVWNFCMGRDGKTCIIDPYVHENGQVSCILTGVRGQEWIMLNEGGRLETSAVIPQDDEVFCRHERTEHSYSFLIPHDRDGEPRLARGTIHGDGTCCIADFSLDGTISRGLSFVIGEENWLFTACRDGSGRIAMAYMDEENSAIGICFIEAGTDKTPLVTLADMDGMIPDGVILDFIGLDDGSVVVTGQRRHIGSFLVRVNALGETVFAHSMEDAVLKLTATPSGFAGYFKEGIAYFDEDGGIIGTKEADYPEEIMQMYSWGLCGMTAFGDGIAVLYRASEEESTAYKIRVISGEALDTDEQYQNALFSQKDCRLLDAQAEENGVKLLLKQRDGEVQCVSVARDGAVREAEAFEPRVSGRQKVEAGTLTWQEIEGGARVALEDEQENEIWSTRTLIHTAADRLEWMCAAQLPDGNYALGGRYLTQTKDEGERQEGVLAIIGNDAVLRKITTIPIQEGRNAGCVCDLLVHPQKGLLMLTSSGMWTLNGAQRIQSEDGSVNLYINVGFEIEGVRLLMDGGGSVYLAGTDGDNGQNITALVSVDLDTGETTI